MTKSKYYNGSNKLVIGKIKDEIASVAIDELVKSKTKIYLFLVDYNSEHKKAKGVNRNVVEKLAGNEYKDVLSNNKHFIHSLHRIRRKDDRIGTYKINKISLSCFDDKIYIQNNVYDELTISF